MIVTRGRGFYLLPVRGFCLLPVPPLPLEASGRLLDVAHVLPIALRPAPAETNVNAIRQVETLDDGSVDNLNNRFVVEDCNKMSLTHYIDPAKMLCVHTKQRSGVKWYCSC